MANLGGALRLGGALTLPGSRCLRNRAARAQPARLERSVVTEAGDFLFVPPGVPQHQAVNLSETEPAVALIARNDAGEHERVVPYSA
jgi:uncharacterized RmlC-like cupin family protein